MDNITHSLTALAMARAGLNRLTSRATLLLVLSANAPDIDILASPLGALRYLEVHRGYTHCLLALPVMAALSVVVTAAIYRERLPWLGAWIVACLGAASHLLLDWTNGYGIRLLLPFSSRWFHLDIASLYDGIILAALLLAAVWPSFAGLVYREIGARVYKGRLSASAVLIFFVVFDLSRALLHERAIAQMDSMLYGGEVPLHVSALPSRMNPLLWNGIVETGRGWFRNQDVNAVSAFVDPDSSRFFAKVPRDQAIDAANATPPFRYFRYFARFPVWTEQPAWIDTRRATRIDLTDLQFGAPNSGSFHCIALVDVAGRVLESSFTFGSGGRLGWGPDQ